MTNEQKAAFLRDLTEITRKHGIAIDGCGCCGSPYLIEADTSDARSGYGETPPDQVKWIAPSNGYDWRQHSSLIVQPKQPEGPVITIRKAGEE